MRVILRGRARGRFALALAILVVLEALSFQAMRSLSATQDDISRSLRVLYRLDDLQNETLEAESSTRGYLVSGLDLYLQPYYAATRKVDGTLAELRTLLDDSPRQRQLFEGLRASAAEKLAHHARLVELRKAGGTASLDLFLGGKGRELMDQVRDRVTALKDQEDRILRERTATARRRSRWSVVILVVGSVLGFGILIAVYRHLNQEIAARLRSEEKVLRLNRLYAVLSHTSQGVAHIRDRDALFREVCRIAVEDGGFRMAWVGAVNPRTGAVEPVAWAGFEDGYLGRIHIATADSPEGRGPTGSALRERRHFVCFDIATDPLLLPWRDDALARGYRASAAFPILCRDSVVGVFTTYAGEPGFFDAGIVGLLGEVTSNISFGLDSMEQEEARRAAEQEILRLNQDLEHRVAARTAELERVASELETRNREVERANQMKSQFLARMSHELRTPLNAIVGYSDLLAEEGAGPLAPTYKRFVGNVQEGARHLLEMVNDVLDLSKIEAGRIDLKREAFHSSGALEEVLAVITPLARIKNITVENRLPSGMVVSADRTRFKQILYNLLSNAVKFTPEGGSVWIGDCSSGNAAGFSVCDSGIGIAAEEMGSVFDEFYQVGQPPAAPKEGTGLGLAITKRLAELHGGTIWVESTPGEGSRFSFSLGAGSLEPATAAVGEE